MLALMGLDPAIGYPHQIANDAIPVSNHPMGMTGSSPVMTGLIVACGTSTARAVLLLIQANTEIRQSMRSATRLCLRVNTQRI